ncbi:hypothetical protein HK102_000870 [Quaeritorhiza haematococci]|nr:hypothetical protein HK102_000870 [Quaeritorhiza haematococci]
MSVQGAHLPPELTTRIAIFTTSPEDFLTFLCICRRWHAAARNAHTVSEWMYQRYRRAALIQITLLAMKSATKEHARQSQTRGQKVEKESDRSTDVGTGTRSQSGRTLLLQSLSCLLRRRFTPPDSHCDWLKVAYQVATLGKATEGLRLDPDVLDRILSHSPDVVHRDTARLALLSSVLKSDLKAVKYLLGLRCVRFADSVLDEVLHMATTKASLYGDTSVLELLLGSRMRDEGAEHEKAGKNTKLFAYSFDTKQLNEALRDNAIPLRGIAAIPLLLDAGADEDARADERSSRPQLKN